MVGNWLLSAARVFTQEPLLCAPLMAAVCWAENSVHLSPQPAIATALNTDTLCHRLTCFHPLFYSVCLSILSPDSLLPASHTNRFMKDSGNENKYWLYICVLLNKSVNILNLWFFPDSLTFRLWSHHIFIWAFSTLQNVLKILHWDRYYISEICVVNRKHI